MPRLLRDILEDIVSAQPDMEIVAGARGRDAVADLERQETDVLILLDVGFGTEDFEQLTNLHDPGLKLVIVTYEDRDEGSFSFRRLLVTDLSPKDLVYAMRVCLAGPVLDREVPSQFAAALTHVADLSESS